MQGRVYTISMTGVAVTAAKSLVEIAPAANKPVEIVGIDIGQSTDFGDAQDETLTLTIARGNTTTGTGTSTTAQPVSPSDAAAGLTAKTNMTAEPTGGTQIVLHNTDWNVRSGYINWWPEGCRPSSINGNLLLVKTSAPADSVTMDLTVYVRELL